MNSTQLNYTHTDTHQIPY